MPLDFGAETVEEYLFSLHEIEGKKSRIELCRICLISRGAISLIARLADLN